MGYGLILKGCCHNYVRQTNKVMCDFNGLRSTFVADMSHGLGEYLYILADQLLRYLSPY